MLREVCVDVRHRMLYSEMRRKWAGAIMVTGSWVSVEREGKEHSPEGFHVLRELEDILIFLDSGG